MKSHSSRLLVMPVMVIVFFLFMFIFTTPVFAEDGQPVDPTATTTPEVIAPAPLQSTPEPELITSPTEEPTVTPEATLVDPGTTEPASTLDLTEQAPTEQPTVAAPASDPNPAATTRTTTLSEVSASAVVNGVHYRVGTVDYQFVTNAADCPGGVESPTCSAGLDPIVRALTAMSTTGTPTDRKLYLEDTTATETDPDYMNTLPITIAPFVSSQVGGLLGLIGKGATPESVYINGSLAVLNMTSGFTIQNLKIANNTYPDDAAIWIQGVNGTVNLVDVVAQAAGEDSSGIVVANSNANVVLNRVESSGNAYHGLLVQDNVGNVTITNSTFDENNQDVNDGNDYDDPSSPRPVSVLIDGAKNVTINGMSASENPGGVGLNVFVPGYSVTIKNSIFNNNLLSDANKDDVKVIANSIILDTIQVTDSRRHGGINAIANNSFSGHNLWISSTIGDGLIIDTCQDNNFDGVCETTGPGTVTITNGYSSNNGGHGVDILAKGAITIKDFEAAENFTFGFEINNSSSIVPSAVTITNITAYHNGSNGVVISSNGAITIKNIASNSNTTFGLRILHSSAAPITITNDASVFNKINDNGMGGFNINSQGPVTIFNIEAKGNSIFEGGNINNSGAASAAPVTIGVILSPGDSYVNDLSFNGATNLSITSRGLVTLTNVMAYNSGGGSGLIIDNTAGTAGVVIKKTANAGNYFDVNFEDGARIITNGPVTIDITSAGTNGGDGLDITSKGGVTIIIGSASYNTGNGIVVSADGGNGAVTLTGKPGQVDLNGFLGGVGSNILVTSKGNITLSNLSGINSDGYGALLDNSTGTGNVSIVNGFFDENLHGLSILTKGTISWIGGSASNNADYGAQLSNTDASTPKAVTVSGVEFLDNATVGVEIITEGAVTLKSVYAEDNVENGITISSPTGVGNITLTDVTSESNNAIGLDVTGHGAVVLINVVTEDNLDTGINISTTGAVTFTKVESTGNEGEGVYVTTPGTFTINKPAVGYNDFSGNVSNGLHINVGGKVTLTRVYAGYGLGTGPATSTGVIINNTIGTYVNPVVITDLVASGNADDGLFITTYGTITMTKVAANGNNGYGVRATVVPSVAGYYPTVTLTDITTNTNGADGFYLDTLGNVVASMLNANSNSNYGVNISNTSGKGNITITNTKGQNVMNGNGADGDVDTSFYGLAITTNGSVTITGLEVSYNDGDGVVINNSIATSPQAVTLNNVIARENRFTGTIDPIQLQGSGIKVASHGNVTINNSWSSGNSTDGISIVTTGNVIINKTGSIYNDYTGIFADLLPSATIKLIQSTWFGNLRNDPVPGDRNLTLLDGNLIIS